MKMEPIKSPNWNEQNHQTKVVFLYIDTGDHMVQAEAMAQTRWANVNVDCFLAKVEES